MYVVYVYYYIIHILLYIILYPTGRSVVKLMIRPDRSEVSVDVRKSVAASNVAPYKFTSVSAHIENTFPVKSVELKST